MKANRKRWTAGLLLFLLTVLAATGITYGHFEATIIKEENGVTFTVPTQKTAYLFRGGEGVEDFTPLEANSWVKENPTTAALHFRVSNVPDGDEKTLPPEDDLNVSFRVLVTEGAGKDLTMVLKLGEEEFKAAAEPIPQGSTLYETFGAGWIYRFYSNTAHTAQVELMLAGGKQSVADGTLTVSGKTFCDSLLRLEITTF